jgi:hypothetical protein
MVQKVRDRRETGRRRRRSHHEVPELRHGGLGNLREATITGFCSARSLLELTRHVLERAAQSLRRLTLDASPGYDRKRSPADRCHAVDAAKVKEEDALPRRFLQRQPDGSLALVIVQPRTTTTII